MFTKQQCFIFQRTRISLPPRQPWLQKFSWKCPRQDNRQKWTWKLYVCPMEQTWQDYVKMLMKWIWKQWLDIWRAWSTKQELSPFRIVVDAGSQAERIYLLLVLGPPGLKNSRHIDIVAAASTESCKTNKQSKTIKKSWGWSGMVLGGSGAHFWLILRDFRSKAKH